MQEVMVPSSATLTTQEERNWAMICHLSALSGYVIPLGNILGPLVVWLMKKDSLAGVDRHGRDALNLHLSYTIYLTVALTVFGISLMIPLIGWLFAMFVALPAVVIIALMELVYGIVAGVRASQGQDTHAPMLIRFF